LHGAYLWPSAKLGKVIFHTAESKKFLTLGVAAQKTGQWSKGF
jgi:hypothetical protein